MDEAKAKPRTVIWGGNIGSANHMGVASMERATPGAEFKKVQIGGAAESYAALKGKVINVGNFGIGEIVAYRSAGLKPLAVLSETRDAAIPDVPTAKELGYDAVFCNEHNLYAPKGTPPDRIAVLAQAFSKALATDYVKKEYKEKLGATIEVRTGKELEQRLAADLEKFKPMTTNMKPN
jgi:tripartite-type tricarboxylate transporter receptor subunit TctC